MKFSGLLLPVVCFAAAALAMWAWRPAHDPSAGTPVQVPAVSPTALPPVVFAPLEISPGLLAKLGLTAMPSLDDVFAVEGVERNLRMTLFIQNATSKELAEALVRADEDGAMHSGLRDQIWLRWTELDPAAAIASSANHGQAWWAWARTDPQAALAAAQGKTGDLVKVIRAIGNADPAWARRIIAAHPEADQPMAWNGILDNLTKHDPPAAATLAMERKADLKSVLDGWTARQPEAARAWIAALPDGPAKRGAMEMFVRKRCAMDPAAGLPEAVKLPPGKNRDALLTSTVNALALTDPDAATAAAVSLPAGDGRQQALGSLAEKRVAEDPAKALEVLSQVSWGEAASPGKRMWQYYATNGNGRGGLGFSMSGSEPDPAFTARGALEKLVDHDAAGTLQTLAALPPDREAPLADAVWQWSAKDPEAASAWLRDQPAGEARDRGIDGLVRRLTGPEDTDFDAALTWAASASPAARDKHLRTALNSFASKDPTAAATAADQLGIAPGPMAKYSPGRPY